MNKYKDFLLRLNSKSDDYYFWKEYAEFCENLEKVDIDLFIKQLPVLLEKIHNDGSLIELFAAIEKVSSLNAEIGNNLYDKIVSSNKDLNILPHVMSGLFEIQRAETIIKIKELFRSGEINKISIAIRTIAIMKSEKICLDSDFLKFIENQFDDIINSQKEVLWPLVLFACRCKRKTLDNADTVIERLSIVRTIEIQMELIRFLFHNTDYEKDRQLIKKIFSNLISLDIKYQNEYKLLSYTLRKLVKMHKDLAMGFLDNWVIYNKSHAKNIELFEPLFNEMIISDFVLYEELICTWLNRDQPVYQKAVFEILRSNKVRDVEEMKFSKDLLKSLSYLDVKYITFKILGYVYDKNISTSLVYSILENKINDKESVKFLSNIFFSHFIFNYYGTIDFLRNKKKSARPEMKKIIEAILHKGEKYYDLSSNLENLKEFSPSEKRLIYINKIQNKKISKSVKRMEENNDSFLSHVKSIQLKNGKTSFCKYRGRYSDRMELQKISVGGELPRGEFIDPIGQKKSRIKWQNYKRSE